MDEEYDVIVLGTGLTECILAGLLSAHGKKVLHLDRNDFYGGESASVNLTNLYKIFYPGNEPPAYLGHNRDWNIDLIPKFTMAHGKLVKIILHTGTVANNLEWKCVSGTYVMQTSQGGLFSKAKSQIHKVPATDSEALKSSLMGLMEKRRCKKFFQFAANYDPKDQATWKGLNPFTAPFSQLAESFSLELNTLDFIGHAVALYTSDEFINRPCDEVLGKIRLYMDSIGLYGNSPFIYPIYGIGGIPEGFSRLCAIFGGTYMLKTPVDEILFNEEGKVVGVRSGDQIARTKTILCDPSYAREYGKVHSTGQVIRAICILNHAIPNTSESNSSQIIIPQRQTGRHNDIYIGCVSSAHCVCPEGYYIAICSTVVETSTPEAELQPAFDLVGEIQHTYIKVYDTFSPNHDGRADNLYISKSYDATSHFETACEDVLSLYHRLMGEPLNYEEPLKPFTETQQEA
jgi:Rab GDP dissociation inhibitor